MGNEWNHYGVTMVPLVCCPVVADNISESAKKIRNLHQSVNMLESLEPTMNAFPSFIQSKTIQNFQKHPKALFVLHFLDLVRPVSMPYFEGPFRCLIPDLSLNHQPCRRSRALQCQCGCCCHLSAMPTFKVPWHDGLPPQVDPIPFIFLALFHDV